MCFPEKGVSDSPHKKFCVGLPYSKERLRRLGIFGPSLLSEVSKGFRYYSEPLTELTKEDRSFSWDPSQQNAFQNMKDKLCTTPVLAYPNFDLPFIFTTDASKVVVAAILSQVENGVERPAANASRQMNKAEQAYAAFEAELLALLWATK